MRTPLAVLTLIALFVPSDIVRADDAPFFDDLSWRCIGPSRGGRVTAVTGVHGDTLTYYMGATGGGVWKTTDAGLTWAPITDGQIETGSVGAVAVAPSDPNVIYVGMGERDPRGNFSHGDGVYRSRDAGDTWEHVGLADTRHIARIVVDPRDPDVVLVAALGHIWGPHGDRGVYRSTDGGERWERVLEGDDVTGAIDLVMDPSNPRILFAGFWQVQRSPWSLDSGGPGSGLFRSRDGGTTWTELTDGLPSGTKGKIGVTVSAADPKRVWAIVEGEKGGVFRSENGGDSFRRVNEDRSLRQRAWYYTHIRADTKQRNTVWVLNVGLHRSTDGGVTFERVRAPHGDHHDLWINPDDSSNIINGNDGGANVTFDGGRSWTRQDRQPTAQFYHVAVDNRYPYRVYGAQQDNSTASVSSRSFQYTMRGLYAVGGGESGYIAIRPDDPNVAYAGSYGGYMTRYDHATGLSRNISVWPENPMGGGVEGMKERFQWTFPIVLSPHDPDVMYVGAHRVFRSTNEGQSWEPMSPDLTTNDPEKQQSSGGPITQDNTSVEYYCTIFTIAESPQERGVIWGGSDDGLVHVTRDDGATWTNVTPEDLPEFSLISLIEASPHDPAGAYLAVNRYKHDDFSPFIYRTHDYGATWERIDEGIGHEAFVRAVREDPVRPGLLYAGTETGMYVSFNDGWDWESLQLDLPATPITDLVVKDDDLVVATQGRSFWILSGLGLLRQWDDDVVDAPVHLLTPDPAEWAFRESVAIRYHLAEESEETVRVEVLDDDDTVVAEWDDAPKSAGMNTVRWSGRYPDATKVPGAVMWGGGTRGPGAPPGAYAVRLTIGDESFDTTATVNPDPRLDADADDYRAQFELLVEIRDTVSAIHDAVNRIRTMRGQIDDVAARIESMGDAQPDDAADVVETGTALKKKLADVEEALIQTRSKSSQDPLNFPIKLNDKVAAIAGVVARAQGRPTEQSYAVFEDLAARLAPHLEMFETVLSEDVPAFNEAVAELELPAVWVGE